MAKSWGQAPGKLRLADGLPSIHFGCLVCTKHAPPPIPCLPRSFRHCCHHQKSRELYDTTTTRPGACPDPDRRQSCHSQPVLHAPASHVALVLPGYHLLAAETAVVVFDLDFWETHPTCFAPTRQATTSRPHCLSLPGSRLEISVFQAAPPKLLPPFHTQLRTHITHPHVRIFYPHADTEEACKPPSLLARTPQARKNVPGAPTSIPVAFAPARWNGIRDPPCRENEPSPLSLVRPAPILSTTTTTASSLPVNDGEPPGRPRAVDPSRPWPPSHEIARIQPPP